MEPLISVIVPVYKVEPYLRKCVDSILNQTYTNLEIILVDDGSPDNCGAICDDYAVKDLRVTVIHKKNGGLSDARNAGMAQATGAYWSFVDSDDLLPENALEILKNIAISQNAQLVIGGHQRFTDDPAPVRCASTDVRCWTPVEAMEDMLKNGCASWARLYQREIHHDVLFPVGEINEDEAIVLQLLSRCERIAVTDAVVYYYRCRPESITTSKFSLRKMAWYRHCKENLCWILANYPELKTKAAIRYRGCLLWSLTEIALSDNHFSFEIVMLLSELREHKMLFDRIGYQFRKDQIRLWILLHFPFRFYAWLIRTTRKLHNTRIKRG